MVFLIPDVVGEIFLVLTLLVSFIATFSLGKLCPANIFLCSCWFLLYLTSYGTLVRAYFAHDNQGIHVGFVTWLTALRRLPSCHVLGGKGLVYVGY